MKRLSWITVNLDPSYNTWLSLSWSFPSLYSCHQCLSRYIPLAILFPRDILSRLLIYRVYLGWTSTYFLGVLIGRGILSFAFLSWSWWSLHGWSASILRYILHPVPYSLNWLLKALAYTNYGWYSGIPTKQEDGEKQSRPRYWSWSPCLQYQN